MNPPTPASPLGDPAQPNRPRSRRRLVAIVGAISLAVGLTAVVMYSARKRTEIKARAVAELTAIADMKMTQILNWREERLSDGRFVGRSPDIASDAETLLANPAAEPARTRMMQRLTQLKSGERYEQIGLYRPDGTELVVVSSRRVETIRPPREEIEAALASREPVLTDLHRDADDAIHVNVLVPIFPAGANRAGGSPPIAAAVLRLNPKLFLFPLLQHWPLPSDSAETILARREGDEVVFLNELRRHAGSVLRLRHPIDAPDLPLAVAMRGSPGVIEGRDYRNEPVVAVVYPLPDSPWFMAAKMDLAEMNAPVRAEAMETGALALGLALSILAGGGWLWRREESRYLQRELAHETALHETEAKYARYVNDAPLGIVVLNAAGLILEINPAACAITGYSASELVGGSFLSFIDPRQVAAAQAHLERTFSTGHTSGSIGLRHKLAWEVVVDFSAVKLSEERGLCFFSDVTAERKTEEAMQLFRALVDRSSDAIEVIDVETGRFLDMNERGCADLGCTRPEALALHVWEVDPNIEEGDWAARAAALRAAKSEVFETLHRRQDGTVFPVEVSVRWVKLEREYFIAAVRDITERKRAEEQLRRLSVAVEQNPAAILITDPHGTIEYVNPSFTELTGFTAAQAVGKNPRILKSGEHSAEFYRRMWEEFTAGRTWRGELRNRKRNGELYWEWATIAPIVDASGRITDFVAIKEDMTDRKRAEDALRESQERFSELAETIGEVFWIMEAHGERVFYVSPAFEKIWGRTCESLYDDPRTWIDAMHPEDRERIGDRMRERVLDGAIEETYRIYRPDGSMRWIRDRAFPVHDAEGRVIRIVGVARDVTERQQLEAQFLQAQKMEAVGQLAGGVAHDFNNILSVITVHSDLMLSCAAEDDPDRESITEIQRAAERAAALTRQLLVFSRQQVVEPKVLDLNAVVRESEKMLRRLIGEDVRLATKLAPDLGSVKIDPGQLNQVVMNLAVNARDAMPQGGQLTIETSRAELDDSYAKAHAEVQPGAYALLSVADTGCGIPPEVQARIFEPFFTTKGVGHGTGLGLAVVHGIVKQAGGHLGLRSEPGAGTTFKIYLPAIAEAPRPSASQKARAARGTETILLVDDELAFRRVTQSALMHLGYTVIEAASGAAALEAAAGHAAPIHLLLTDVVMPGMGGRELADTLRATHPHLKILYQSGYTDDAVVRHGVLHSEVAFLQKPFTLASLAAKVREVLDS